MLDVGCGPGALAGSLARVVGQERVSAREMWRVVRPGGTIAACVWDYAEAMTMLGCSGMPAAVDPDGAAPSDEGRSTRPS